MWNEWTEIPGGLYHYPVVAGPVSSDEGGGRYQLHVRVEGCPMAACCVGDACADLTRPECDALGGRMLSNSVCWFDPCAYGSCCTSGHACDDCDGTGCPFGSCAGGTYHGGVRCNDQPCGVCEFGGTGHCQPATGSVVVPTVQSLFSKLTKPTLPSLEP